MASKSKIHWCNPGWLPYSFGFCPDKEAWDNHMKVIGETQPYPDSDGRVTHFRNKGNLGDFTLVTFTDRLVPNESLIGLIVHEATHVWQEICYTIGEEEPSSEFEAYSMQAITQELINAWNLTKGEDRQIA